MLPCRILRPTPHLHEPLSSSSRHLLQKNVAHVHRKIPGSFFTPSTWGTHRPPSTTLLNWATWRSLFCHSPSGCSCATYRWRSWTSFIDSGPPIFSNFLMIMGTCLSERNLFMSHQFTTLREIPTGTLKAQRKRGRIQFFCKDLLMLGIFKALWRKCLNYPGTTISKRCPGGRCGTKLKLKGAFQSIHSTHILDSLLTWHGVLNLTVSKQSLNQFQTCWFFKGGHCPSKEVALDCSQCSKQVVFWNK